MKRFLLILVVAAAAAYGQESQPQPETVRKLVKIQHVNVNEVTKLLMSWVRVFPSNDLGVIIMEGAPERIAEAEEVIREVDRPGARNAVEGSVELDAYFIAAGAEPMGGPIPPLVMPVLLELQQRFAYAKYGLLDSTLVLSNVGKGGEVEGEFSREKGEPVSYSLGFKSTEVKDSPGERLVYFRGLRAEWIIPYKERVSKVEAGLEMWETVNRHRELRIQTEVSIPAGKLVVVGKAGSPTSAEAIFLVLRARLVE